MDLIFECVHRGCQCGFCKLAFLYCDDIPFEGFEPLDIQQVSVPVTLDFVGPKLDICLRKSVDLAAFVPVPEASVDENDSAVSWQDNVGSAGKGADILPEAEAAAEQFTAYRDLRGRVIGADVRHTFVPLMLCHCVCHIKSIPIYSSKLLGFRK